MYLIFFYFVLVDKYGVAYRLSFTIKLNSAKHASFHVWLLLHTLHIIHSKYNYLLNGTFLFKISLEEKTYNCIKNTKKLSASMQMAYSKQFTLWKE